MGMPVMALQVCTVCGTALAADRKLDHCLPCLRQQHAKWKSGMGIKPPSALRTHTPFPGVYGYPVLHPTENPRFKFGQGDGNERFVQSTRLNGGWYGDHTRIRNFPLDVRHDPYDIEGRVRQWLSNNGHPLATGMTIRPKNAAERQREIRNGEPRQAREIHHMNNREWRVILDLLDWRVSEETKR